VLHGVVEPHAHVSGPGHSTDVDDVPALLHLVHIDGHEGLVAGANVLEEVVSGVSISMDNTEGFISDLDVGLGSGQSPDSIRSILVGLECLKLFWVGLGELNRSGAESAPVFAAGSDSTLFCEPRVRGVRWQVLGRHAGSEERHGDSE